MMGTNKDQLDGVTVFVRVVEAGGFSKAANLLDHSTSYISKEVTRLENRLGVRLLNRTTRTISLTDLGKTYYESCRQIVADAEEIERCISSQHEVPKGILRLSANVSFGQVHLKQLLPLFLKTYPEVKLEVEFNDRLVDIVAEGFDVVIRAGNLKDSSLINRKIMQSRGVTVASPDYLQKRGCPQHPQELKQHDCITYSHMPTPTYWEYSSENDDHISVPITPRVNGNSAELQLSMALAGIGIVRLPIYCCEKEINEGKLVAIFENFKPYEFGIYAVYPHRKHLSAKVRMFIDFLVERFSGMNEPLHSHQIDIDNN